MILSYNKQVLGIGGVSIIGIRARFVNHYEQLDA